VLDQDLFRRLGFFFRLKFAFEQHSTGSGTAEPGIDVACSRNLKSPETLNLPQPRYDLFRDLPGRLAQLLCQLEAQRQSVLTQPNIRRLVNHDPGQIKIVLPLEQVANPLTELLLKFQIQSAGAF
jgi:hypothetical protein